MQYVAPCAIEAPALSVALGSLLLAIGGLPMVVLRILEGAVDGRIAGAERSRYYAVVPRRVEKGRVGPV